MSISSCRIFSWHQDIYHGRQDTLQDSAENVEDITSKPNDYELDAQALSTAATEIFDDLGREDNAVMSIRFLQKAIRGAGLTPNRLWI